jgi:hypothetical protein
VSDSGEAHPGGTERRTAVRIKTEGSVRAELVLDMDSDVQSLSGAGMKVRLELPLEEGTRHHFTLALDQRSFEVQGIVRHCRPSAGPGVPHYEIGVEFEHLDPSVREALEQFVREKLGG